MASALLQIVGQFFSAIKYGSGPGPVTPVSKAVILNGTGTSKAYNCVQVGDWTLSAAAGGNTDQDVRAMYDPAGDLFDNISKVTGAYIEAASTNVAAVEVKGAVANGLLLLKDVSDVLEIQPGSSCLLTFSDSGKTFDATHKVINLADAGTAGGSVRIVLWGV